MNPQMRMLLLIPAAFFVPIIHEFVKAWISTILGDPTPRHKGMLTLNPLKYFEPIGFFFMMAFQMGWARPVPTSALHYKDRRMGVLLTYGVPVIANLMLGIIANILVMAMNSSLTLNNWLNVQMISGNMLAYNAVVNSVRALLLFAQTNVVFALFSLLPVYPMAGNKLIQLLVSPEVIARITHYEKPMQIIMILLISMGMLRGFIVPWANAILGLFGGFPMF